MAKRRKCKISEIPGNLYAEGQKKKGELREYMMWGLTLYLAVANTRLDCKKVWQWKTVTESILSVWIKAKKLEYVRRRKVHQKLQRFLATTWLLPTRRFKSTVPSPFCNTASYVKSIIRKIKKDIAKNVSESVAVFIGDHITVVPATAKKVE